MKLENLKERTDLISFVLAGMSVLLAVLILAKVAGYFTSSARARKLIADAVARSESDPTESEKYFAKSKETAEEFKKGTLFVPPPAKPKQPIKEVQIVGDSVLINGKWYKVGDKVGDAEILAIGPTYIRFTWQDKEFTVSPFGRTSSKELGKDETEKKDADDKKDKAEPQSKPTEESARQGRRGDRRDRPRPEGQRRRRRAEMRAERAKAAEAEEHNVRIIKD